MSTGTVAPAFVLKVKSSGGGYFSGGGSRGFGAVTESVFGGGGEQGQQLIETPPPVQEPIPTRTHTQGERHGFILRAQQELNTTENCKVAERGVGSAGQETDYLGSLTSVALSCYQRENGFAVTGTLTPETYAHLIGTPANTGQQNTPIETTEIQTPANPLGALQEKLRALRAQLASLLDQGEQTEEPQQKEKEKEVIPPVTTTYTLGDKSVVIQQAKVLLNASSCKISLQGVDSAGQETNELTQFMVYALRCYQRRNNLPVTGNLDPATWTALTGGEQSQQQQTQTPPVSTPPQEGQHESSP